MPFYSGHRNWKEPDEKSSRLPLKLGWRSTASKELLLLQATTLWNFMRYSGHLGSRCFLTLLSLAY
jgi:hypothetical protein